MDYATPEMMNIDGLGFERREDAEAALEKLRQGADLEWMRANAPVYFDESGTRMRASAFQALEQVAAFADACRDTMVSITGHTDSSGDENYNRALSLARARVVADWLEQRGIGSDRLQVAGVGSSLPIADNATRFGRSLNRRIDIAFAMTPTE